MKTLFLFLISFSLYAQQSETIRTGRPGQSIGANVVGTKVFQLQSGIDYNRTKTTTETEAWVNNNVIRYGLNEKFEVSGVFDYRLQDPSLSGFDNYQLGGRVNLIDPDENSPSWLPALCFQARVRLKGGGDFKKSETAPIITISAVKDLKSFGSLTTNYILSYDGFSTKPSHGYTLAWGYSLNENWGTFIEEYATYTNNSWTHAIDTGFSYLANKDTQYDLAFGVDLEKNFHQEFISIGVSWRTL